MQQINITVEIVDSKYPMTIDASDEEIIRKAAAEVTARVKDFRAKFQQRNIQDSLAVVAFNCLVKEMKVEYYREKAENEAAQRLQRINNMISAAL